MKRIKNFVKNTFKDFPKEERERLIESITEMLIEKVEDLVEKGYTLDDAVDKTVVEFGDADDFEPHQKRRRLRLKNIKHYKNDIIFSIGSIVIIIGMLAYVNYLSSTDVLWFIIPGLALLFWPLSTIYRYLNRKSSEGDNKDE